ncbi:MAG: DUF3450 domain-containing protein [Pseudomonadota bacterium]
MNTQRLKCLKVAAVVLLGSLAGAASLANADETLQAILDVSDQTTVAARKSQQKIDRLAEETRSLLGDYKTVMKQVEGLKVYNNRLRNQIANQERRLEDLEASIQSVTITQRQMPGVIVEMIDSLEQFVELDVPFHIEERRQRIAFLRGNQDRSDVSVAEKFRQVLEAYKIENEYGRKIDAYKGSVDIGGVERDVNFFRVGRVALLYQTTDTEVSGAWDQEGRSWVELPSGEFRNAIMKGLRIARKEASIDLLTLPIAAPEVAE